MFLLLSSYSDGNSGYLLKLQYRSSVDLEKMDNKRRCYRDKNRESKKTDDKVGTTIGGANGYGVPTIAQNNAPQ